MAEKSAADKAAEKAAQEEQERNDASKADKVGDVPVVPAQGLPPTVSEIDERVPVPVSSDAPKAEQDKQVALQSHSGEAALNPKKAVESAE